MKNFNYINRESVNPIDLNVLGRTYDTLEQGHQEAVKSASDLEVTMASLDLNEAESQWRQAKIAEIKQTVTDNSNHGNAYGALDDIIAKAGDIASDQGMIGRLQAQKDFKTYRDQLDKRGDIPEGMKEMFREENQYTYADKVDNKTGAIIGSTKWEPSTRPVATVDRFKLMSSALSIAAKESGGGSNIQFLDDNGKPTRDASKSATGEMYIETSGRWERLSESKIRSAITSATNSTAGAKESLEQDYKFATWKHLKNDAANGDKPSIEEGVTDKHGNMLSYNAFVDKQVTPFVNAAKYNNYTSDIRMGTALQTRRAQEAAGIQADLHNPLQNIIPANSVGKTEIDVDNYSTSVNNKNAANKSALDIIGKYHNHKFGSVTDFINKYKDGDKVFGPGLAVNKFIKGYEAFEGNKISDTDKFALMNAVKGYHSYNTEQKKIENTVGKKDKEALRFGESVANNTFTAGKSKWDDDIVSNNNKLWSKNDKIDIAMSPNLVKNLIKQFNVSNISELGLTSSTNDDGELVVSFNENDRNMLPTFISNLKKADDATGASWSALGNLVKGDKYKDYTIKSHSKVNAYSMMDRPEKIIDVQFNNLANAYDTGIQKSASVQKAAGVQKGILSIEGTAKDNFKEIEIDAIYSNGGMKTADWTAQKKAATEVVNNMFASGDFNAGALYEADAANNFVKTPESNEIGALISYMYQKHPTNITRNATIPSGIADARRGGQVPLKGYVLNFTVPASAKEESLKKYAGKSFKIMYGGGMKEALSTDPALSTANVVTNIYNTSKATNTPAAVLPYNNALGSTDVIFDKGNININFLGSSIPSNEKVALEYMKNVYTLEDLKTTAKSGMIRDQAKFVQAVGTVVNNLSGYTGKDFKLVETAVINYLNQ